MSETKIIFWADAGRSKIDPKLYSDRAENLVKEMKDDYEKNKKLNKRTQVRKFYDEVQRLYMESRRLNLKKPEDQQKWDAILPMVNMLSAKAAYAKGRELVSDRFLNFIKNSVDQITDPRDLTVFANFFEAFMGYYRLYLPAN
ncbi:MAG: type III-A CRISPR-associated protein Csm2 [Desulfococcaceae bacterium]